MAAGALELAAETYTGLGGGLDSSINSWAFPTGFVTFLGVGVARDYFLSSENRHQFKAPEASSPFRRAITTLLNHPKIITLAASAAIVGAGGDTLEERMDGASEIPREPVHLANIAATMGACTEAALQVIRQGVALNRGESSAHRNLLVRSYNALFEHPIIAGVTLATYAHLTGMVPKKIVTLPEQAAYALILTGLGAAGSFGVASIFHTESISTMYHSMASRIHTRRKDYASAIEHAEKSVLPHMSKRTKVENLLRRARLHDLNGDCITEKRLLKEAADCLRQPEHQCSVSDALRTYHERMKEIGSQTLLAESTHRVFAHIGLSRVGGGYVGEGLVFKHMKDKQRARQTYAVTDIVANRLREASKELSAIYSAPIDLRTEQPIDYRETTDDAILVTRLEGWPSLYRRVGRKRANDQRTSSISLSNQIHYAGMLLAEFHHAMTHNIHQQPDGSFILAHQGKTVNLPRMEYKKKFWQRGFEGEPTDKNPRLRTAKDSTLSNIEQELKGQLERIISPLGDCPPCFIHGDNTTQNVLVDQTRIDYEKACIGHPFIDVASFVVDMNSTQLEDSFLQGYRSIVEKYVEPAEFTTEFERARLFAALGFTGTTLSKKRHREAKVFMRQARQALVYLGEEETKYILEEYLALTQRGWLVP